MNMQLTKSPIGLDGIPAAETALSHVDGQKGELIIAGQRVGDLADSSSFEGVTARLWAAGTGHPIGEAEVRAMLGEARRQAFARLPQLLAATQGLSIVDGFRAATAGLRSENGLSDEATIVGALPVIAAALIQRASGDAPVAPNPALGHAADTLAMIRGRAPQAREAAALDAYLVTVCDHGMNASTFATRVVASTQANMFAAVTAGYCALTGPLHGGAPEPVLEMLDAIGTQDRIATWIDGALARGERLMGFGHRIYQVRDPRADVLKAAIERLSANGATLPFASAVEAYARDALRQRQTEPPARHQCGIFHGNSARCAGHSAAGLHADFRGSPRGGLDRACARARAYRPAASPELRLYRIDARLVRPLAAIYLLCFDAFS